MRYLYFLIFLFLLSPDMYAQKENNIWYMGIPQALDFNTSPPRLIPMQANVTHGGASVCDSNGNLLFYTNGRVVLDKHHNIMPGSKVLYASSSMALADGLPNREDSILAGMHHTPLILQPNAERSVYHIYYTTGFFKHMSPLASLDSPRLAYTVVDMQLSNGNGDVPSGNRNLILDSFIYRPTTLMSQNQSVLLMAGRCNSWLLYSDYTYVNNGAPVTTTYNIKSIGEDGRISSHSTTIHPYQRERGTLRDLQLERTASNNIILENVIGGTVLGLPGNSHQYYQYFEKKAGDKLYSYDFDKNIGKLSNFRYRGPSALAYFSPQGSKILSFREQLPNENNAIVLTRFDTTYLGDSTTIVSNTQELDLSTFSEFENRAYKYRHIMPLFKMRTGIDGNLYVLLTISYYDTIGTLSSFVRKDFVLRVEDADKEWSVAKVKVVYTLDRDAIVNAYNTNGEGRYRGVIQSNLSGYDAYPWYRPFLGKDAVIHHPNQWVDTAAVVPLCKGRAYLKAPYPDLPFVWWNGSTADSVEVTEPGSYRVTTTLPNCSFSQDIVVVSPSVQLPPDTTICMQTPLQLRGVLNLAENPVWNTGENTPNITVTETGRYILRAESVCGRVADTIQIKVRDCTCNPFVPNAFTPNGDGVNDVFKPMMQCNYSNYSFELFNRFGNRVFESRSADDGWDGLHLGKPADFGVYFWQLQFKNELGETMHFKGDVTLLR